MDQLTNYNPDGTINTQYYYTACKDIIEREAADRGLDINKPVIVVLIEL